MTLPSLCTIYFCIWPRGSRDMRIFLPNLGSLRKSFSCFCKRGLGVGFFLEWQNKRIYTTDRGEFVLTAAVATVEGARTLDHQVKSLTLYRILRFLEPSELGRLLYLVMGLVEIVGCKCYLIRDQLWVCLSVAKFLARAFFSTTQQKCGFTGQPSSV